MHLGVSEGYDTLGVRSVLELGVQSTLLVKKMCRSECKEGETKNYSNQVFLGGNFCDADASNDLQVMSDD